MKKVTVFFAHPFMEQSVANKEILSYLSKERYLFKHDQRCR